MTEAKTQTNMSTELQRVAERARRNPDERQLALAHLIDEQALERAYRKLRRGAAVGVDGVTKDEYGENLEDNLKELHERLKSKKYRHQPIRRVHIPKGGGKTRPLGISAVEDKIVQGALKEVLEAIYEQDFIEESYGARPGRSAHHALSRLQKAAWGGKLKVILEADITSFFDKIDRRMLVEMLEARIADRSLMALVSKCLHVGVLEGEKFFRPEEGTAQGSKLSPLLGNIYLHHVLDRWFAEEVKPRMRGEAMYIRYCDDFIMGFENEQDAQRVMDVLGQRLGRFNLELSPEKTRLTDFTKPEGEGGGGSFDFAGFTIFWKKNRKGKGRHLSWKTRKGSRKKFLKKLNEECKMTRHQPVGEQHKGLARRIRGHFNYFGVNGNVDELNKILHEVRLMWFKWLNRRSQRKSLTWERFKDLLKDFPLPKAKVYHDLWRKKL